MGKIWYGDRLTSFELYVGVLTQFEAEQGRLCVKDVVVIADSHQEAATIAAVTHPEWDLQTLTCVSTLPWFVRIELDPACPQIVEIREALMEHIVEVPVEGEDDI